MHSVVESEFMFGHHHPMWMRQSQHRFLQPLCIINSALCSVVESEFMFGHHHQMWMRQSQHRFLQPLCIINSALCTVLLKVSLCLAITIRCG